jgi:hypothetical protein
VGATVWSVRFPGAWLAMLAVGASVVIGGCGGSSGHASTARTTTATRSVSAGSLTGSGCSTAVASAPALAGARTAFVRVSGLPFGVAVTRDGRWSFVDEVPDHVELFSDVGFAPRAVRSIGVPEEAAVAR